VNAGSGEGDFHVGRLLLDYLLRLRIQYTFMIDDVVEVGDVVGIVLGEEEADKIVAFLLLDPSGFLVGANPLAGLIGGEVPAGPGIQGRLLPLLGGWIPHFVPYRPADGGFKVCQKAASIHTYLVSALDLRTLQGF